MTDIDLKQERAAFEEAMNSARFFPAELNFGRRLSPGGRDEYVNSHLESCWVGWQARASNPPSPADRIPIPQNADQAHGMVNLGLVFLKEHAPERLTEAGRAAPAVQAVGEPALSTDARAKEWEAAADYLESQKAMQDDELRMIKVCAAVLRTVAKHRMFELFSEALAVQVPPSADPAPRAMTSESNDALCAFARYWKLDGDWMTCKGCKRNLIASRDGELLAHAAGCKNADQNHPWWQLRSILLGSSVHAKTGTSPKAESALQSLVDQAQELDMGHGQAVPKGMVLVPVEPTEDMVVAFAEVWYSKVRCIDDCEMEDAYAAMLAAAPKDLKVRERLVRTKG